MHSELYQMGWRQLHGAEGYAHRRHGGIWAESDEDRDVFMRQTLRRARELDGESALRRTPGGAARWGSNTGHEAEGGATKWFATGYWA